MFMALSVSVVSNDGGCHFLKKQHNQKNEKKNKVRKMNPKKRGELRKGKLEPSHFK